MIKYDGTFKDGFKFVFSRDGFVGSANSAFLGIAAAFCLIASIVIGVIAVIVRVLA